MWCNFLREEEIIDNTFNYKCSFIKNDKIINIFH